MMSSNEHDVIQSDESDGWFKLAGRVKVDVAKIAHVDVGVDIEHESDPTSKTKRNKRGAKDRSFRPRPVKRKVVSNGSTQKARFSIRRKKQLVSIQKPTTPNTEEYDVNHLCS